MDDALTLSFRCEETVTKMPKWKQDAKVDDMRHKLGVYSRNDWNRR